jgi:hypothetical protein
MPSVQITEAAVANLPEEQCLLQDQTLDTEYLWHIATQELEKYRFL